MKSTARTSVGNIVWTFSSGAYDEPSHDEQVMIIISFIIGIISFSMHSV